MNSAIVHAANAVQELTGDGILDSVLQELRAVPVVDVHTHLFMPSLGKLGLWGIDELITYHYLEAELFRFSRTKPAEYWRLSLTEKADLIWRTLFVENTPLSEATRGVIAVLQAFGLATSAPDLSEAREFFASQDLESHIRRVFELSGLARSL